VYKILPNPHSRQRVWDACFLAVPTVKAGAADLEVERQHCGRLPFAV
jgi:hypothetical protein